MQNKANFRNEQMNISSCITNKYEDLDIWWIGKNKPNSKPNKANLHLIAENAEYAEKKNIFVSDCSIERYAPYHISPRSGLGHPAGQLAEKQSSLVGWGEPFDLAALKEAHLIDEHIGQVVVALGEGLLALIGE